MRRLCLLVLAVFWMGCAIRTGASPHGPGLSGASWVDPVLYPLQPSLFDTGGGTLSYVDVGSGPTVLLVHGTPTWSFLYRDVIADLRADHRCVAVDNLGFGLSEKPADADYTPAAHAARLVALLEHLDLRDVTLVIHDVGGPIGLAAAGAVPERITGLVVLNTFSWSTADDRSAQRLSRTVAGPLGRWLYLKRNASPRLLLPSGFGDRGALSEGEHLHYTAPFPTEAERVGPWQAGVSLGAAASWYGGVWDARASWADLPAEIVWGMADPWFGAESLARWQGALPQARVTELEGVGHFSQEEAPRSVAAAIRRVAQAE